jgi:hypothetical protein
MVLNVKPKRCRLKGCEAWFIPRIRTQLYCTQNHKNRAAQRRLRQRAKIGSGK